MLAPNLESRLNLRVSEWRKIERDSGDSAAENNNNNARAKAHRDPGPLLTSFANPPPPHLSSKAPENSLSCFRSSESSFCSLFKQLHVLSLL
jgi:hypothetical protein